MVAEILQEDWEVQFLKDADITLESADLVWQNADMIAQEP